MDIAPREEGSTDGRKEGREGRLQGRKGTWVKCREMETEGAPPLNVGSPPPPAKVNKPLMSASGGERVEVEGKGWR